MLSDFTILVSFLSGTRGLEELHLKIRGKEGDVLALGPCGSGTGVESTFDKTAHARPAGRVVIPELWRAPFVRSDFRAYENSTSAEVMTSLREKLYFDDSNC